MRRYCFFIALFLLTACVAGREDTAVSPTSAPSKTPTTVPEPTATPTLPPTETAVPPTVAAETPISETAPTLEPIQFLDDVIVSQIGGYRINLMANYVVDQYDDGFATVEPADEADQVSFRYLLGGGLVERMEADDKSSILGMIEGTESFSGGELINREPIELQGVPGITAVLNVTESEHPFMGRVIILLDDTRWFMMSGGLVANKWEAEGEQIFAQLVETLELFTPLPLTHEPEAAATGNTAVSSQIAYRCWELGFAFSQATIARLGNSELIETHIATTTYLAEEIGVIIPQFDPTTDGASPEAALVYLQNSTDYLFNIISAAYDPVAGAWFRLGAYINLIKFAYDADDEALRTHIYEVMSQDSQTIAVPPEITEPFFAGLQAGLPDAEMAPLIWDFVGAVHDFGNEN